MSRHSCVLALFGASLGLFTLAVDASGRPTGGGGLRPGGGGGGGGGRPAPAARPAPIQRPAAPIQRPAAPVQRPSFTPRPTPQPAPITRPSNPGINPGNRPTPLPRPNPGGGQLVRPPTPTPLPSVRPSLPKTRPDLPTTLPNLPKTRPDLPTTLPTRPNLPGQRPDFNLPGNITRPNLPDRPAIRPPGGGVIGGGGNLPNRPNFPNLPDRPIPKTLPYPPNAKGNLPDFQKKLPDLFPGPRPGGGGSGIRPINPGHPTGGDIANWLGRPGAGGGGEQWRPGGSNFRPGAGGGGEQWARPSPQVRQNFQNNFASAIQRNTNNNNFIRTGDRITNINLTRNNHFNTLVNRAGFVNTRLRPNFNTWFRPNWWSVHRPVNLPFWSFHFFNRPPAFWWRPVLWTSVVSWMPTQTFAPPVYFDFKPRPPAEIRISLRARRRW